MKRTFCGHLLNHTDQNDKFLQLEDQFAQKKNENTGSALARTQHRNRLANTDLPKNSLQNPKISMFRVLPFTITVHPYAITAPRFLWNHSIPPRRIKKRFLKKIMFLLNTDKDCFFMSFDQILCGKNTQFLP